MMTHSKTWIICLLVFSVFTLLIMYYEDVFFQVGSNLNKVIVLSRNYLNSPNEINCFNERMTFICQRLMLLYNTMNLDFNSSSKFQDLLEDFNCSQITKSDNPSFTSFKKKQNNVSQITNYATIRDRNIVDICPEVYMGMLYGYGPYLKGFIFTNCTNARPLSSTITVVFNLLHHENKSADFWLKIITRIEKLYNGLQILLATLPTQQQIWQHVNSSNVKVIPFNSATTNSLVWNELLEHVNTTYAFIGDNIQDFTINARFERQISILSSFDDVGIVGGAIRNDEGFWKYNCYQSNMSNYILNYQEGYYNSKNECMHCDYIERPFMLKMSIFKKKKFDSKLSLFSIFADFFLRLKQNNIFVMSCPDVMHFVYKLNEVNKEKWFPIAKKWTLNRIVLPNNLIHSFTCQEIGITCDPFSLTKSYLIPPCCLEIMTNALISFTKFCDNLNISCIIDSGSALGAVKLYSPMPWDLDADMSYQDDKYSILKQQISKLNYKVSWDEPKTTNGVTSAYVKLYADPSLYIEIYPWVFPFGITIPNKKQTKIKFGNYHVYVPNNPGLYARNRYGGNNLKHSVSWITLNKKSSFDLYDKVGTFPKCNDPVHHACLDHFSADGNIQFKIP